MKPAGTTLAAHLDATTTGWFRHLYAITPRVGSVLYLTDHTSSITSGGHAYLPNGGGSKPAIQYLGRKQTAGLEENWLRFELLCGEGVGLFASNAVREVLGGALDGAWIRVERVFDESATMGTIPMHEGPVSEVRVSGSRVEVTVGSGVDELLTPYPLLVVQPGCSAQLFDSRCGLNATSFTASKGRTGGTESTIYWSGALSASPYYVGGLITFTSGVLSGETRGIREHGTTYVVTDRPFSAIPDDDDTFTLRPGCPKTLSACKTKFGTDNSANFRGFPFVPKPETVSS